MIRIGIVEDDKDIRESFTRFLKAQEEFICENIYGSAEDLLSDTDHTIDILLLDINLPGISGLEAIPKIKSLIPGIEIMMITIFTDSDNIFKSICAGASSYLVKNTPLPQLKESILQVSQGGSSITPAIARKVIEYFQPSRRKYDEDLTDRERDIIQGILDGLSYKMIADKLFLSVETVRSHIKKAYRKLNINSKGELMHKVLAG